MLIGGGLIAEQNIYDARRRLVARRYEHAGNLLADVRYQYDLSNNREARQEVHRHGRTDLFTYDDDNRLTRADIGAWPDIPGAVRNGAAQLRQDFGLKAGFFSRIYSYDTNSLDLLTNSAPINPDALLLPPLPPFVQSLDGHDSMLFARQLDGASRPPPDGLGNTMGTTLFVRLVGASEPTPVLATLTYNGHSQLVSLSYSNQGTPILIEYQHQPGNLMHYRKITRDNTVVSERALVYDRDLLLEEYENAGVGSPELRARYYYADEDSPFAADLADAQGNLERYYYLRDAQGSVIAVADDLGNVVERISYDPWGQPVIQGRDTAPPRVSIIAATASNELLVQFTEPVMPPPAGAGPGMNLVTATVGLDAAFQLSGSGGPILLDPPVFEENLPAGPLSFGTSIRLHAQQNLPSVLTLHAIGGALVDEWGLTNLDEQINFSLPGTNAARVGSTVAPRLGRSGIGSSFLFHGQYFDYDAGLLYVRARFYDPYTGNFLQQDPEGYADSVNLYAAFGHNPVSRRDPTGLATKVRSSGSKVKPLPSGGGSPNPPPSPPKPNPPPGPPPHPRPGPANQNAGSLNKDPVPGETLARGVGLDQKRLDENVRLLEGKRSMPAPSRINAFPDDEVLDKARGWKDMIMKGNYPPHDRAWDDARRHQATMRADPSDERMLAEFHISGADKDAPGLSYAQDPHFAVTWGIKEAHRRGREPHVIMIDPNHPKNNGTTVRGTNLEEGDEVTMIWESHYREAVLYSVQPVVPGAKVVPDPVSGNMTFEGGYKLIEVKRSRGASKD